MTNSWEKYVDRYWVDTHVGETVVVMGNGASLKDVPIELLHKYPTFGTNHIYVLPFQPTYYVCVDELLLDTYPHKIYDVVAQSNIAFLSDYFSNSMMPSTWRLYQLPNVVRYDEYTQWFPGEAWVAGGTVTYVALKMAYGMGFDTVLLVGCDRDKEWNHFSDDYPALGDRNQRILDGQEYHLRLVGEAYKKDGRRIINLSPPSALDEFYERGSIEEYL